jgi:hypothetical protein
MPSHNTTPRTEPHDDARLLPRFRDRARLERSQAQALHRVLGDLSTDEIQRLSHTRRHRPPTPAGDAHRLRGIPAVSKDGLGGAIPGTRPDTLRWAGER